MRLCKGRVVGIHIPSTMKLVSFMTVPHSMPHRSAATAVGLAGHYLLRCRRAASTFRAGGGVAFETLDVFTTRRFGGNPLAIVYDEEKQLTAAQMQSIAAEFGYSETTFVLPPSDEANTAHVRIFSPTYEMPFAGHPNVGTATALAWRGNFMGRPVGHTVRFEEKAGLVLLNILHDAAGQPTGAMLTAPEPFSLPVPSLPIKDVAAAVSLEPSELVVSNHPPLVATTGLPFIVAECASLDALARSRGAPAAFEELCALLATVPPKVLLYTHTGTHTGADGVVHQIRARMHRANGTEDAGTGAANACLAGVLAFLARAPPPGCAAALVKAHVVQGVEMGRPSELRAEAERLADGVGAVRIGGSCVAMTRGELLIGLHRLERSR